MLQQTQVSRVLEKYPLFLKQFPTLRALARAERSSVIRTWRGMGYNNRAVRLHLLAQTVVNSHGGVLPRTEEELTLLPGIGRYTARALLSSVFHIPVPVVDVNVHRFFSRLFWPMRTLTEMHSARAVASYALRHLPERRAYDWNQALMDLGATICTARAPRCMICPVAASCRSRAGMKRVAVVQKKQEPSLYGTPDRIYRGRIVECLRGLRDGRSLALEALGSHILSRFSGRNRQWLLRLLNQLERDGLVRIRKGGSTIRVRLS
jgi:A/G-specific adenine glycosylase